MDIISPPIYVSLIVLAIGVALGGLVFWLRALRDEIQAKLLAELGDEAPLLVDPSANCLGLESLGMAQVRGNGCLATTKERVLFRMWMPERSFEVQRSRITAVDEPRSHLGKSKGMKLLKLSFVDERGQADSLAWAVRDLEAWKRLLSRPGA